MNINIEDFIKKYNENIPTSSMCKLFELSESAYYRMVKKLNLQKRKVVKTHGMRYTHFYKVFSNIYNRCYCPSSNGYDSCGGRGIIICDRWYKNFLNFKEDMYESYLKHVEEFGEKDTILTRIDNNKDYCVDNCKWIKHKEIYHNKIDSVYLTYDGSTKTVAEWAKLLNIKPDLIYSRINSGITDIEDIFYKGKLNQKYIKIEDKNITPATNIDNEKFIDMYNSEMKVKDICKIFGIAISYYYKLANELNLPKRKNLTRHGMRYTRFYKKYYNMRIRCEHPKTHGFKNYGGKGIKVCERWKDFNMFKDDMYESYIKHSNKHGEHNTTLDRIDVNGNYEPDNCRWANKEEQCNNKTTSVYITHNGETKTMAQWARIFNITPNAIRLRMLRGITESKLLLSPSYLDLKTIFQNKTLLYKKIKVCGKYIHLCEHINKYVVYETYLKCLDFLNIPYIKLEEANNVVFSEDEVKFINNKYEDFVLKVNILKQKERESGDGN